MLLDIGRQLQHDHPKFYEIKLLYEKVSGYSVVKTFNSLGFVDL